MALADYMHQLKNGRIAKERSDALRTRLLTLQDVTNELRTPASRKISEFLPSFPDYAFMPEFRALMEVPTEEELDENEFCALFFSD